MGSLVRVGENFTDENITPVGAKGGGGAGSGPTILRLSIGDGPTTDIVLRGRSNAEREGRWD